MLRRVIEIEIMLAHRPPILFRHACLVFRGRLLWVYVLLRLYIILIILEFLVDKLGTVLGCCRLDFWVMVLWGPLWELLCNI